CSWEIANHRFRTSKKGMRSSAAKARFDHPPAARGWIATSDRLNRGRHRMKQLGAFVAISLLTLAMVAPPIFAQSQSLIAATGVPGGPYARFFSDISKTCPRPTLRGVASQGSVENLERVMNNKANLAFVQADVLFAKKLIEHDPGVEVVRAYLVLYLEEIHILIESSNTTITKF